MANDYTRAAAVGAVCGMRIMLGPALAARTATRGWRVLWGVLSVGELIGDKLPATPSRLAPGPLAGRLLSGAAVGYAVCPKSRLAGAACGAAGALAGAFAGYWGRRLLGETLRVPDPAIAVLEDALAFGLGRRFAP